MITVISPSKTQDFDCANRDDASAVQQLAHSELLINNLRQKSVTDLQKLMKISPKLAQLNWQRFQDFSQKFTTDNAKPALLAFKGDVYTGIDTENYNNDDFAFAQQHLRILSGLYGALRPLDLIQPYRLEMGTRLLNERGKNLYQFWDTRISEQLNQSAGLGQTLVNLASLEYFKAIKPKHLNAKVYNIIFKENKAGTYKVIGIYAKRARGIMVDYIIKNRIDNPQTLQQFTESGYCFNPKLSNDTDWVFTR